MQGVDAFVHEVSAGKLLGEEDGASSGVHEFVERIKCVWWWCMSM